MTCIIEVYMYIYIFTFQLPCMKDYETLSEKILQWDSGKMHLGKSSEQVYLIALFHLVDHQNRLGFVL